jgi:putative hydrolase
LTEENQPEGVDPEEFAKFLSELMSGNGSFDPAELANIAGLPNDPIALKALMDQLKKALVEGESQTVGGVNWKLAEQQALAAARSGGFAVSDSQRSALKNAWNIADLWLDQATSLSGVVQEPKVLTRELWVLDALPLFQSLAGPIAERVAEALSENLEQNLPSELDGLAKGARGIMRSAGGTLFAMQLGQTLGKLSQEVLTGGDIGLPFYAEARAALVAQNIDGFITDNSLVSEEAMIYLSVRELSHARLFRHSRWLRDSIIAQITNYAQGIRIDGDAMSNLAHEITPENADALRSALESGELLAERTEEQLLALSAIEHLLALIEGWVTVVTESATKLLPTEVALGEVIRRRSIVSPARATFSALVGLDLQPKRSREAAEFWRSVSSSVGAEKRDQLWDHPDLLPTSEDIDDAAGFVQRIQKGTDQLDRDLRDLLGE